MGDTWRKNGYIDACGSTCQVQSVWGVSLSLQPGPEISDMQEHIRRGNVAVVGAGPAGIVAARELQREGHAVAVFEQMHDVGGVWLPDGHVESDLLGQDPSRRMHTSLYESLRTNLPRELMGFSDFPFLPKYMKGRSVDSRRFPHHSEVQQYLQAFVEHYNIRPLIRFNACVTRVRLHTGVATKQAGSTVRWEVVTVPNSGNVEMSETVAVYDAVIVANGHYSVPRIAQLEGMDSYPAKFEHSHSYRRPEAYAGKRVLLVGTYTSGEDIAWDLAPHVALVVLSGKKWLKDEFAAMSAPFGDKSNMLRRPWVSKMHSQGMIEFEGGATVENIDVVMFCTGYQNSVPFLDPSIVSTSDGHVRPLYHHLLHPRFGASLSFIGLPATVACFSQFEIQSQLIARLLSGRAEVPSQEAMEEWADAHYRMIAEACALGRHVHKQGGAQFAYNRKLAEIGGMPAQPGWRKALWDHTMALWAKYAPNEYRDHWDDPEALEMACNDIKHIPVQSTGA